MKACTALSWSSPRTVQRKCWRTRWKQIKRWSSTERRRNNASPILPESTSSPQSFDVDQDNKTIATTIGPLPLSPIMDPSYWAATARHQAPKAKKSKATNSVERQFRKNPFAHALATPIRQCTATQIRLPSSFLQGFGLIAHPETRRPWWVPRSLAWDTSSESQEIDAASDEQTNFETERGEPDVPEEVPRAKALTAVQSNDSKLYGPSAYVLARQDLISAFTARKSGYEQHTKRLFGGSSSRYTRFGYEAIWRRDMDSLILDRMRQKIVKDLLYLSRLCTEDGRHYIVKYHGWDDLPYNQQAAVLWFGATCECDEATKDEVQPGPFATYDRSNDGITTSVAVHNIPMLLGTTAAAEVRENSAIFGDGFLFMLEGARTTNLQVKFWRLQGYLAKNR